METYQPIYDAVRSRLSNCDIGAAVEAVLRDVNLSHYAERISEHYREAADAQLRPSVLYRPKIAPDGNQWIALYGDNLQEGVAGCGDSPAQAMWDFDRAWNEKMATAAKEEKV